MWQETLHREMGSEPYAVFTDATFTDGRKQGKGRRPKAKAGNGDTENRRNGDGQFAWFQIPDT